MPYRLLVLGALLLSGCYRMNLRDVGARSVLLNSEVVLERQSFRLLRHFYRETQVEYIFGYNEQENRLLKDLLDQECADAPTADIINLRVERHYRPLDAVAAVLTLGFYVRSQWVIEGDLILPGPDALP